MRIGLFTPYSPEIGGGAAQLRSHLAQMPDLPVEWYYLSAAPVQGARRHWLGKPLSPWEFAADLAARSGLLPGSTKSVREIVSRMNADLYWVVAHYEGISVAAELLSLGKPVHLTVHDEPLAMLIVSRRFRPLWPLMTLTFARVLRGARSVDVTSTNMRDYFQHKYGVACFAVYEHVPGLPEVKFQLSEKTLIVGHVGKLYHSAPFRRFILACRNYAEAHKRDLKIIRIGSCSEMDKIALEHLANFENCGELSEKDALPVLATCNFVYAMYPDGFRFRGFRRTSLPIKLSTYIQAQRLIFAHTPPDSGLAQLVEKHHLGVVCGSDREADIRASIQKLLELKVSQENFESVRRELMGMEQIQQLRNALSG
jgi:glycosyltransferase involved in cell wall biosynthesis